MSTIEDEEGKSWSENLCRKLCRTKRGKRGRRRQDEPPSPPPDPTRLQQQLDRDLQANLADLPTGC
ncbi:MAG: hypothetical protein GX571_10690, partial [Lentisphaerae bacterium]|nr:hypothetical protein [Lentisphaerota bacterium]